MNEPQLHYHSIDKLAPNPRNACVHSPSQIRKIADCINRFGFNSTVKIDGNNMILAGHGRVEAAKLLGLDTVPTLRLNHLSKSEARAYALADNRLAELAGLDKEILAIEFKELMELELDFDLTITGYEIPEIDFTIQSLESKQAKEEGQLHIDTTEPVVSRLGDHWILGEHSILNGDARQMDSYAQLVGSDKAQIIVTDPPFNLSINGHVSGKGMTKHEEFIMASGEMSDEDFFAFLKHVFSLLVQFSINGSLHYVFMDWRHIGGTLHVGERVYTSLKNMCVWNKSNGGMGSFYRSKHELVPIFKNGDAPHVNNVELGRHGRYRTNVWDYAGVNTFKDGRQEELQMHPTVKPVAMIADAILDASHRGHIVLDPFCGSGSTILAAEQTGRRARCLELSPRYVDVSVRRWQEATGQGATLAENGKSFDEMSLERANEPSSMPTARGDKEASHGKA